MLGLEFLSIFMFNIKSSKLSNFFCDLVLCPMETKLRNQNLVLNRPVMSKFEKMSSDNNTHVSIDFM